MLADYTLTVYYPLSQVVRGALQVSSERRIDGDPAWNPRVQSAQRNGADCLE